MNLYLIARPGNANWDQYSSAVVVAESKDEASNIHPRSSPDDINFPRDRYDWSDEWVSPSEVLVTYLGVADLSLNQGSVVCASYNAG